jgi:hypothetical protein
MTPEQKKLHDEQRKGAFLNLWSSMVSMEMHEFFCDKFPEYRGLLKETTDVWFNSLKSSIEKKEKEVADLLEKGVVDKEVDAALTRCIESKEEANKMYDEFNKRYKFNLE